MGRFLLIFTKKKMQSAIDSHQQDPLGNHKIYKNS